MPKETLTAILERIKPPNNSLFFGIAYEDGCPILLDLDDETLGPVLISGPSKNHLLEVIGKISEKLDPKYRIVIINDLEMAIAEGDDGAITDLHQLLETGSKGGVWPIVGLSPESIEALSLDWAKYFKPDMAIFGFSDGRFLMREGRKQLPFWVPTID